MTRQSISDYLGQSINADLKENFINGFLGPEDSIDDDKVSSRLGLIIDLNENLRNNPLADIYFLVEIVHIYKSLNKIIKCIDIEKRQMFYAEKRKIIKYLIYRNFLKSFKFDRTVNINDQTQINFMLHFCVIDLKWKIHEFITQETVALLRFKGYDVDMKDAYRLHSIISNTKGEIDTSDNIHTDKYSLNKIDKKNIVVKTKNHEYIISNTRIHKAQDKDIDPEDFIRKLVLLYWYNLSIESTGFFNLSFR